MYSGIFLIVAILLYPLNSFLAINWIFSSNNDEVVRDVTSLGKNDTGKVKGVERIALGKVMREVKPQPAVIQPMKISGAEDISLPNAHASIVLDVDSGNILHYKNGKERRQIASLTKMMTAILVMEKVKNLDETVVISEEAVYIEGTKIGCPRSGYCISERLKVGENITVKNLLKAMLMNSANDAAYSLGRHIGGSEENFAKMMNEKALEMGLKDTNFCTASGLEIDGRESECYSTAYDIARIGAYSMKYELIWEIFRLPNMTEIFSVDGKYAHQILNTDIIMDQHPNIIGGKTGFTPLAGHSLLMGAVDGTKKHKVIAVVLDDPYRWQDIKTMISWTFLSYKWS